MEHAPKLALAACWNIVAYDVDHRGMFWCTVDVRIPVRMFLHDQQPKPKCKVTVCLLLIGIRIICVCLLTSWYAFSGPHSGEHTVHGVDHGGTTEEQV